MHPLGAQSSESEIFCSTGIELAAPQKSRPTGDESPQGFSPQLTWSHYRALMRVENLGARDFYEREAIAGGWDKRTLERQIQSFYHERLLKSTKPELPENTLSFEYSDSSTLASRWPVATRGIVA